MSGFFYGFIARLGAVTMTKKYLFGDTDLAARRLKVLAEVFAASSETFISEAADCNPRLVVDLGCGPGGVDATG